MPDKLENSIQKKGPAGMLYWSYIVTCKVVTDTSSFEETVQALNPQKMIMNAPHPWVSSPSTCTYLNY